MDVQTSGESPDVFDLSDRHGGPSELRGEVDGIRGVPVDIPSGLGLDEEVERVVEVIEPVVRSRAAPVPCVAWVPREAPASAVLLLGHGGSGTKRTERHERLGSWFAARGVAALAIDGPLHGDRLKEPLTTAAYQAIMVDRGITAVIAGMVRDWHAALAALEATGRGATHRVGYVGLSMGSRFGIPLAASLGERLGCAVFGKFGLTQSARLPAGLNAPQLIRAAAESITAPVVLHLQQDDELFPIAGGADLLEAFGSPQRTLHTRPGPHGAAIQPDDEANWCSFVLEHLTGVVEARRSPNGPG